MLVVGVNQAIWLEFSVYPLGNECLKFRSIITSSTISSLPKLKRCQERDEAYHWNVESNHFHHVQILVIIHLHGLLMKPWQGKGESDIPYLQTILAV